tara:strand:+ start:4688 stop:6361 length:1674 start_codon:yes stop_codon:yes gene_type:complete
MAQVPITCKLCGKKWIAPNRAFAEGSYKAHLMSKHPKPTRQASRLPRRKTPVRIFSAARASQAQTQQQAQIQGQRQQVKVSRSRAPKQLDPYAKGYGESLGRLRVAQLAGAHPWGTPILFAIVYTFFSIWPFPLLPQLSILWYVWGILFWTALIYAFSGRKGFLILLTIFFILFNYGLFLNLYSAADIYMENSGISLENPFGGLQEKFYASYGSFKNPRVTEEIKKKGIVFERFKADDQFQEGEPASLTATVTIEGFKDLQTTQVAFFCYEQSVDGDVITEGVIYVDYSDKPQNVLTIQLQEEETSTHEISCLFPKGLTTGKAGESFLDEGQIIGNKKYTKKRIVIEAQTKFSQITSLKLFNVEHEHLKRTTLPQGEDIEPETQLPGQRKPTQPLGVRFGVIPSCTSGCGSPYALSVITGVQPITELKKPRLTVELRKQPNIFGILAKIDSLQLTIPNGVELVNEPLPCEFEGGNANAKKLEDINEKLEKTIKQQRIDQEITIPLINFKCHYKIPNPEQQMRFKLLEARAIYDVIIRHRTDLNLYKELELSNSGDST